ALLQETQLSLLRRAEALLSVVGVGAQGLSDAEREFQSQVQRKEQQAKDMKAKIDEMHALVQRLETTLNANLAPTAASTKPATTSSSSPKGAGGEWVPYDEIDADAD